MHTGFFFPANRAGPDGRCHHNVIPVTGTAVPGTQMARRSLTTR